MTHDDKLNGFVGIVYDEPIPGIPSHRFYGPYETHEQAWEAVKALDKLHCGVLPLRKPETLVNER